MEKHEFYFCYPLKLYMILYCTGTVFFHCPHYLLRVRLKLQNPVHSYVREREKVDCKCTMQCTVHFIITLFNIDNVLQCVIYQLNFAVLMYVTRITRYITLCHVITRYITLYHVITRYITLQQVISRYITLYHVIYSFRYYPWLHITAVDLGTYYPWIRGSAVYLYGVTSNGVKLVRVFLKLDQV